MSCVLVEVEDLSSKSHDDGGLTWLTLFSDSFTGQLIEEVIAFEA